MKRVSAILTFVALSYGLAWLLSAPLWRGEGLRHPLFTLIAIAIMFTPAVAAAICAKVFEPEVHFLSDTGVILPRGSIGRTLIYSLAAILLMLIISLGALFIADALNLFRLDLKDFSAFRALLDAQLNGQSLPAQMPPLGVLVAIQIVTIVVFSPVNAIVAVGEEIGWRGWLLPRLMPLGTGPAIVMSGVIWGAWHAPLLLLGYNYVGAPGWLAIACMSGMCMATGIILSWLRLRSRSVWPAAVGHGAINASAGLYLVLGTAGQTVDLTQVTLLGWSGWILPALIGVALFVALPVRPPKAHGEPTTNRPE
jgi:uncharacterized protein